jgi:hypothetical protein
MADVSWPGVPEPGGDTCSLSQDIVAAIGDLAQLLDGLIQVAAFGGVPHRGAVQSAVEELVSGGHAPAYRMQIRLRQRYLSSAAQAPKPSAEASRHSARRARARVSTRSFSVSITAQTHLVVLMGFRVSRSSPSCKRRRPFQGLATRKFCSPLNGFGK